MAPADPALARRLFWQALDREAEFDPDSALALYDAARTADPAYLRAHLAYIEAMQARGADERVAQEYDRLSVGGNPQYICLASYARSPVDHPAETLRRLLKVRDVHGENECTTFLVPYHGGEGRLPPAQLLQLLATAAQGQLDIPDLSEMLAEQLRQNHRWSEARAVLEEGIRRCRHPRDRTYLYAMLARLHFEGGDTTGATLLFGALGSAVMRDGRPGLRFWFLRFYRDWRATIEGRSSAPDSVALEMATLARRHGAWAGETFILRQLAADRVDRGDPAAALTPADRLARIADSVGVPFAQLRAYTLRGRVYSKLGRLRDAQHDLLRAVAAGAKSRSVYYFAEAYHNLAHAYEGAGDLTRAVWAADRFIRTARPLGASHALMMSLHDAGTIRWKAGLHAAADAAFAEMVQIIDQMQDNHYWAGLYFERLGALAGALRYYRRGISGRGSNDVADVSRLTAGLVRVYDALGFADSAEAAAQIHDAAQTRWVPDDAPLLPDLLARRGRITEAVAVAREWAVRQRGRGNVQGAALAFLQLADLLLRSQNAEAAALEAARAESLAITLTLTDERVGALRLQGIAHLRLGDPSRALALLREATRVAGMHPTATSLLETHLALGDALAQLDKLSASLSEYDVAARQVELMAISLATDLDRARFRELHLAPFERALTLLLAQRPGRARTDSVVRWSQRRKAALMRLATDGRGTGGSGAPTVRSLAQLQQRLGPNDALVDFTVLDTAIVATVVTTSGAALVPLSYRPDSIHTLLEQLRKPFATTRAGRLDLARAPFDLEVAAALYARLMAPLAPTIGPRTRLLVVPDGFLHFVPFEALVTRTAAAHGHESPTAAYTNAAFVIDRFEVSYLPGPQFLPDRRTSAGAVDMRGSNLLAIAHEAPGATRETDAIRDAWPGGRTRVLRDRAATETAVRSNAGRYQILHFATHARADDRDPLSSHLRLAADASNDGLLHLAEIAKQPSHAELVVLSACESFAGRLFHGEGLMGLARAFLASGAGSVVATRWPVGPSAAQLMEAFYRELATGRPPTTALWAARQRIRRDPETAHPFHWAGFVLISGKPAARRTPRLAGFRTDKPY